MSIETYAELPLAGTLIADGYQGWSSELRNEFEVNAFNGNVGQVLLSETDRLRVWEIHLQPGERVAAHRHVLDYFWTALAPGHSRQHTSDGTTREVAYHRGQTRHFTFAEDQYLLHDLENIGSEPLSFLTVELKEGRNRPLPVG